MIIKKVDNVVFFFFFENVKCLNLVVNINLLKIIGNCTQVKCILAFAADFPFISDTIQKSQYNDFFLQCTKWRTLGDH